MLPTNSIKITIRRNVMAMRIDNNTDWVSFRKIFRWFRTVYVTYDVTPKTKLVCDDILTAVIIGERSLYRVWLFLFCFFTGLKLAVNHVERELR